MCSSDRGLVLLVWIVGFSAGLCCREVPPEERREGKRVDFYDRVSIIFISLRGLMSHTAVQLGLYRFEGVKHLKIIEEMTSQ